MRIRFPLHLMVSGDLDATLHRIGEFLSAHHLERAAPGAKFGAHTLVGPRDSLNADSLRQGGGSLRTPQPRNSTVRAWGVLFNPGAQRQHAPLLMAYRSIPALGHRPVLVRENHLKPGELVIVPESSEMIVVLAIEVDEADLAAQLEWYVWSVDHHSVVHEAESPPPEESPGSANGPAEPRTREVIAGPQLRFDRPLLTQRRVDETFPLNAARPWVQLGPILDEVDYSCLLTELRAARWERREGEIYTQDSFDLLAWCRQRTASTYLVDVISAHSDEAERLVQRRRTPGPMMANTVGAKRRRSVSVAL